MKPNTKRYLTTVGVGLLLAFAVMLLMGIFGESDIIKILIILNDAFFVSGISLICVGGLFFASNKGTFHMLSYSFSLFFQLRKHDFEKTKRTDFYEYKKAKEEKQRSCSHFLVVGSVFIAVSLVFLALFYSLYQ